MIKNLILDWSGTLVDDFSATLVATNAVFENYGLEPFTDESFRKGFRLPYPDFYEEFLPKIPLSELEVHFKSSFLKAENLVKPLEPTAHFLRAAREKGVRLFVLSSMNEEALLRQASDFGLQRYFEAIYAGVLDKRKKMSEVVDRHGLARHETAYVGDMVHDVDAAKSANLVSVALLSGYDPPERLAQSQPDLILNDIGKMGFFLSAPTASPIRPDIRIQKLRVRTRIGVPPEERESIQELKVSLVMELPSGIPGSGDEIETTIDYFSVSERVRELSATGERKLIETLARDICEMILAEFGAGAVKVQVEKAILTNCEGVVTQFEKRIR